MPTVRHSREVQARRMRLAFEAALARGWDREMVCAQVGISISTFTRLCQERRRLRKPPKLLEINR